MNNFKILVSLLLLSLAIANEVTVTLSNANSDSNSMVFKAPTADTSRKIRVELTVTLAQDWSHNTRTFAFCGVHDIGSTLTATNGITGFVFQHYCSINPNCNPGNGNSFGKTVRSGMLHKFSFN